MKTKDKTALSTLKKYFGTQSHILGSNYHLTC